MSGSLVFGVCVLAGAVVASVVLAAFWIAEERDREMRRRVAAARRLASGLGWPTASRPIPLSRPAPGAAPSTRSAGPACADSGALSATMRAESA